MISKLFSRYRDFGLIFAMIAAMSAVPAAAQDTDGSFALVDYHRSIIGRLAGEAIAFDAKPLAARATKSQRAVARDHLVTMLMDLGLNAERRRYFSTNEHFVLDLILPPVSGVNIVATIPATTDTDRITVMGAHYDTVHGSPGANDNASGVAIILSTARSLMRLENRDAVVMIVFFDQEEGGSFGSQAFARDLKRSGANVHSVHTVDMAGSDNDGDRIIELDTPNAAIAATFHDAAERLDIPISDVTFNSSDHLSFRAEGFSAVCMSEEIYGGDMTPHYHKPTDRLEHVDLDFTARVSTLLTAALTEMVAP